MDDISDKDRMKTATRIAIQRFYREQGIRPSLSESKFGCKHKKDCKHSMSGRGRTSRFCTGTWPYIGAHYGKAQVSGRRIRVLFVAMERGGQFWPETEDTFAHTQRNFRVAAEVRSNPHMGGTSQLMEFLVGHSHRLLYSHQFALTNAVKCVPATNSQACVSTVTLIDKCCEHLREEIALLHPHLIITQGAHPARTVRNLFKLNLAKRFSGRAGEAEVLIGSEFVVLTTPHAAHKAGWKWKTGSLPKFLQSAVKHAVAEVIHRRAGRRRMSAAARKRIAAAQRKRWAAVKAAKKA